MTMVQHTRAGSRAFAWTAGLIGALGITAMFLVGLGLFSLPLDPTGLGAWFVVITVMLLAPATLLLMLCSWGVLALYRKLGMRAWPSAVQALLASSTVIFLIYVIAKVAFKTEPY